MKNCKYECKLFISTLLIIITVVLAFVNKSKADHPNHTPVYVVTLENKKNHKVLKVNYVFLYQGDIHHLMYMFKNDTSGGILVNQYFKKLLEDKVVCEVPFKFYNVDLIGKFTGYDIYQVHNTGSN